MRFTDQTLKVPLRVTVAEDDLREALLILYCYSCVEYVIGAVYSSCDAISSGVATQQAHSSLKVDIATKCSAKAIAALLDELALVFGKTLAFQVVVQLHEHP